MTRLVTLVLVAFLLFWALVLTFTLPATAGNMPHPVLDAVASEVAGKPVSVHCEANEVDWHNAVISFGVPGAIYGFTYPAVPVVYLAPKVCYSLHAALGAPGARDAGAFWLAGSLRVLTHEAVHQRGVLDECATDAESKAITPRYIERFGVPATVQNTHYRIKRTVIRRKGKIVRVTERAIPVVTTAQNPVYLAVVQWANAWRLSC